MRPIRAASSTVGLLLAIAIAMTVAGCSSQADPPPLRAVDLAGAVALFATLHPDHGVAWHQVLADGTIRPAATRGSRLEITTVGPSSSTTCTTDHPAPIQMHRLSPGLALVVAGSLDGGRWDYLQPLLLLDTRTGALEPAWPDALPSRLCGWSCFDPSRPFLQADGSGRPYVLVDGGSPWAEVRPIVHGPDGWTLDWPRSAQGDVVGAFAVDAAGDLAYRARGSLRFVPAAGPMTSFGDDGSIGELWTGPDGALHALRLAGDAAGTAELLRFDVADTVTAASVASWTGLTTAPSGWPVTMGSATVFLLGDGRPLVFETLDAPPTLYPPLGVTWSEVQATGDALWLTTLDARGAPVGVTRWTRDGAVALLPPDTYQVGQVFPLGDGDALLGVQSVADGPVAVLRSDGAGTLRPVDLGPSPWLAGHLRL